MAFFWLFLVGGIFFSFQTWESLAHSRDYWFGYIVTILTLVFAVALLWGAWYKYPYGKKPNTASASIPIRTTLVGTP